MKLKFVVASMGLLMLCCNHVNAENTKHKHHTKKVCSHKKHHTAANLHTKKTKHYAHTTYHRHYVPVIHQSPIIYNGPGPTAPFPAEEEPSLGFESMPGAQPQPAPVVPAVLPAALPPIHPGQPAPVVTQKPYINRRPMVFDAMTQNTGRGHPKPEWFNHILINGGINVDGAWGNRSMGYMGENTKDVSVNDAYLNTTILITSWFKAFTSLSFSNPSGLNPNLTPLGLAGVPFARPKDGEYSNVYSFDNLDLEQAYITLGNFDCSPFFFQIGKQFQPFGKYEIHPIQRTMAQTLTESLQTSAEVGFMYSGVTGVVYGFNNPLTRMNVHHTLPVYGALLQFAQPVQGDMLGYDLGFGYMSDWTGVNDVAAAITLYESISDLNGTNAAFPGTYQSSVGAWSGYFDVTTGSFTFSGRYVQSLSVFASNTLSNTFILNDGSVPRPWAADLTADWAFNCWFKCTLPQHIYIGYQASGNAVNLALPKNRWIAGYNIEAVKNTDLGIQFGRDMDYSGGNNGSGVTSTTVNARVAVKFG